MAPASAVASTLVVNTASDEMNPGDGTCSLREAVAAVNSPAVGSSDCGAAAFGPNTIVLGAARFVLSIAPAGGDDNSSGDLNVSATGALTIAGAGEGATSVDAAGLGDRILHVAAGANVTLTGVTITGGHAPNGTPGTPGVGGVNQGAGSPGGTAEDGGGALNDGTLTLRSAAVTANQAGTGGAGGAGAPPQTAASPGGGNGGSGGGVASSGALTLDGATISGNRAGAGGAGGPSATDGAVCQNGGVGGTGGSGGGVAEGGGSVSISGSTLVSNQAGAGGVGGRGGDGCGSGGFGGVGGTGGSGGGVFDSASISVTNSTFAANQSGAGGGGGHGGNFNTVTPPGGGGGNGGHSGSGAGGEFDHATATLLNATMVGGTLGAPGGGGAGGIASQSGQPDAPSGGGGSSGAGGGLLENSAAVTVQNTIIASNSGGNCAPAGSFIDGGHDISFPDSSCPGTNQDPKLGALQDNGGPTQTIGLQPGSPAIDAIPPSGAGCPPTDQRGVARPQGPGCDIGAFEVAVSSTPQPPRTTGTPAPVLSPVSLRPSTFAAAGRGATISRRRKVKPTGTTISYRDSLAARTTFTILKPAPGMRRGRACVKPRRVKRGHRKPKRCTRWAVVGAFTHADRAGANRFHFSGRVRGHRLAPGRYRLVAVARFAGRASAPRTNYFRIKR